MAYAALFNDAIVHVLTTRFMDSVHATIDNTRVPRQADTEVTGLQVMGFEDGVVITAEMPVADTEAVKMSRTCKHFLRLRNLLYSVSNKEQLMQGLWTAFAGIFVRGVLAMEQRTSCAFILRFKGSFERVYVGAEHQEMRAAHGVTGAPVLDASGAQAWPGVQMRLAVRYTEMGRLEVLPENRSLPGEPDSRIAMMHDWLTTRYRESQMVMDEVTLLEHP